MTPPDLQSLLTDPLYMPVGVTPDLRMIRFARVRPDILRAQTFLDGRTPFTDGPVYSAELDAVAAAMRSDIVPSPMLLHVSFCGSTLLSNLLDVPGSALGLREPAVQIALASAPAPTPERTAKAAYIVEALLSRPMDGQAMVIKPSNWVNNLLPIWTDQGMADPIFLTASPRAFLRSVFRGGRERLAYTMRLAQHLAPAIKEGARRTAASASGQSHPLHQAARLSLLALSFQLTIFDESLTERRLSRSRVISYDRLNKDPAGMAMQVASMLALPIEPRAIADRARAMLGRNAKSPDRRYTAEEEAAANREVEKHHGAIFDDALDWAEAEGLMLTMEEA